MFKIAPLNTKTHVHPLLSRPVGSVEVIPSPCSSRKHLEHVTVWTLILTGTGWTDEVQRQQWSDPKTLYDTHHSRPCDWPPQPLFLHVLSLEFDSQIWASVKMFLRCWNYEVKWVMTDGVLVVFELKSVLSFMASKASKSLSLAGEHSQAKDEKLCETISSFCVKSQSFYTSDTVRNKVKYVFAQPTSKTKRWCVYISSALTTAQRQHHTLIPLPDKIICENSALMQ